MAAKQRGLGHLPGTVLGFSHSHLALRQLRPQPTASAAVQEMRELAVNMDTSSSETLDLHRPYVDRVFISCPNCDGTMTRVPEVIDCWFDSGSMPFCPIPLPLRRRGSSPGRQIPSRLHLRGCGPDPGMVLHPPRAFDSNQRRAVLQERHLPGSDSGRPGTQDEQEHRQRGESVERPGQTRRRRHPLVLVHFGPTGRLPPFLRRPGGRHRKTVPVDPLECLLLLHHLCHGGQVPPPTRFHPIGNPSPSWTGGSYRSWTS